MDETDLYGITRKLRAKPEIEPWAQAENMKMVLGQDELWSRRYGVSPQKKHYKAIVLTKIRHRVAYTLHQLANYVEPNEYIRGERYISMS